MSGDDGSGWRKNGDGAREKTEMEQGKREAAELSNVSALGANRYLEPEPSMFYFTITDSGEAGNEWEPTIHDSCLRDLAPLS